MNALAPLLHLTGIGLQFIGTAGALWGVIKTRHEYDANAPGMFSSAWNCGKALAAELWRRLLRLPVSGSASTRLDIKASAYGRAQVVPTDADVLTLIDPTDVDGTLRVLARRVLMLETESSDMYGAHHRDMAAADVTMRQHVAAAQAETLSKARAAIAKGANLAAWGLVVVLAGILVDAAGALS